jgi:hypothetical protein
MPWFTLFRPIAHLQELEDHSRNPEHPLARPHRARYPGAPAPAARSAGAAAPLSPLHGISAPLISFAGLLEKGPSARGIFSIFFLANCQAALTALGRPFLSWAGTAERRSFDGPTLPLFVHEDPWCNPGAGRERRRGNWPTLRRQNAPGSVAGITGRPDPYLSARKAPRRESEAVDNGPGAASRGRPARGGHHTYSPRRFRRGRPLIPPGDGRPGSGARAGAASGA